MSKTPTSKIQEELANATEVTPSRRNDETIQSQSYLKRLVIAVADLNDKEWAALSPDAQKWYNAGADAVESKKDIPDFPELVKEEEPQETRRGRRGAAEPTPKTAEVGDEVKVTTKRGKVYEGTLVEIVEKENLVVIKTEDGEEELSRDRIETIEVVGSAGAAAPEEAPAADPEVGDTVKIVTKRGKTITCKITEQDAEVIVYETADGEVDEIGRDRIETIEVKAKGAAKPKSSGRKGAAADDDAGAEAPSGRAGRGANGGVSVTSRMRELIAQNPDAKKEEIAKILKKENLEFKDGTLDIAFNDSQKIIGFLRAAGWKEPK